MKYCPSCKTEKQFGDFCKSSYQSGGFQSVCRDCHKVMRVRRRMNPDSKNKDAARQSEYQHKRRISHRGHCLVTTAKSRAKRKGLPFDLDPVVIQNQIDTGRCQLTGLPFNVNSIAGWDTPSLDQINPGQGYTKQNVRVVLLAVNCMAGDWGIEKAIELAAIIRGCGHG